MGLVRGVSDHHSNRFVPYLIVVCLPLRAVHIFLFVLVGPRLGLDSVP